MMIEAHQNQIEQLRESFKNRIAEADRWPQKASLVKLQSNFLWKDVKSEVSFGSQSKNIQKSEK